MKDYISGISGLLLSLYVFLESRTFADASEGAANNPALFPVALAILLAIFSSILIIQALIRKEKLKFSINKETILRIGLFFISLTIYVFVLRYVGFLLSTIIFSIFMINYLKGNKKISRESIIYGVIFSIIVFLIFNYILKVPLPKGFLGIF